MSSHPSYSASSSAYKPPSPAPVSPPLPLAADSDATSTSRTHSGNNTPLPLQQPPGPGESLPPSGAASIIREYNPDDSDEDDDDDEDGGGRPKKKAKRAKGGGGGSGAGGANNDDDKADGIGRRKIEITYIEKKEKRHITFSKRKAGIMKKAYELATLTGTQVLLLVVSETGIVYTFTTAKFQPLVGAGENGNPSEGQRLIQQCLAVDPSEGSDYISPPPDGPLLPLPPSANKRPFEANSSIHGGQIALRTRTRPSAGRKGRPAAIHTGPPDSQGIHLGLEQHSPMQLPSSPHRLHPLQQSHSPTIRDYPSPSLPSANRLGDGQMQSAQEYAEMMQRGAIPNGQYGHRQQLDPRLEGYPPGPQDYSMQQQPHLLHSPGGHYQRSPGHSPHLQHSAIDPSLGGPPHYSDDPNLMRQQHPQQSQGSYPQGYDEEYRR